MNFVSFLFSFTVSLTFVPLDHRTLSLSEEDLESDYSAPFNQTALIRTKRTLHKPEKWESLRNEINRKPKSRNTRFYLYTRRNPENSHELCIDDHESLLHSNFDPKKRIVFLINGWLDNRFFAKWLRDGVMHLLNREDFNVIFVAWRSIKELFVAAMLIKLYSEDLAQFIIFLKNTHGISGHSIHCIGHSLGAFMCAFAGEITHIRRVSVLDAGPRAYFEKKHYTKRINRYQADFIDVIHSDFSPNFSLGMLIPIGDVDFFPNNGRIQDGCLRDKYQKAYRELKDEGLLVSLDQLARYMLFCSHYRSHEWFFESVWNKECTFVGVLCPSFEMFRNGECSCEDIRSGGHAQTTCAVMGYDANHALQQGLTKYSPQGKWHIKTSDFFPLTNRHCEYQYQFVIKLGQLNPAWQNGTFVLSIVVEEPYHSKSVRAVTHELIHPPKYGLRSYYQLTKLLLRPEPLPLSKITAIYLSYRPSTPVVEEAHSKRPRWSTSFLTVMWAKLSPIHVRNNRPIFFCHTEHFIRQDRTNLMSRCPST